MNQRISDILREIDRRRDAKEDLCDSCNAIGLYEGNVCVHCLGLKVLLFREEFEALVAIADSILDAQIIE